MRKDILIATNLSLIAGLGLSACKAVGIAPFSPTPESGANSHEFTPTPESDIYPTHFAWMDGRNEVVQKVMAEYGLSSSDIKGFEITVSGLLSATDVREEKVQFINFIDPSTGLNVSAYYDSQNPNGLLNDFETVNRGGGLFVERQLVDLNDPNNYHTLLIISVDAEQKLKSGESTTIEFNPPQWVRSYMPALDPSKNLVINVPIIPELTTTASLGIIPEFLVIDGSVEGIQTLSPESLLPQEVKEKFDMAGIEMADMENAQYDKEGLHITLPSGEVIVLTNTDLQKGIYNGQDNVLQYRDEFNQNVIYAFDSESKTFLEASKYIQPDRSAYETGLVVNTFDELEAIWQKEKLFLIPFDPNNTYFPPSNKIYRDYDDGDNKFVNSGEFREGTPFGNLPDGMDSPFRFVSYVKILNNTEQEDGPDGYIISQQVYNPATKNFSVLHFYTNAYQVVEEIQELQGLGLFFLPQLFPRNEPFPPTRPLSTYYVINGLVSEQDSTTPPIIKGLVSKWFDEGIVPKKLEDVPWLLMRVFLP